MWNLPGPEIKSVSSAKAGGFLTTPPPEKPQEYSWNSGCHDSGAYVTPLPMVPLLRDPEQTKAHLTKEGRNNNSFEILRVGENSKVGPFNLMLESLLPHSYLI